MFLDIVLSEVDMSLVVSVAALSDPEPVLVVEEREFNGAFVSERSRISSILIIDFDFCLVFKDSMFCRCRFDFIGFESSEHEVIGQDLSVEVVESCEGLVN